MKGALSFFFVNFWYGFRDFYLKKLKYFGKKTWLVESVEHMEQ